MKLLHRVQLGLAPPSSAPSLDPDSCAWVLDCALGASHLACSMSSGAVKVLDPATLRQAFECALSSGAAPVAERVCALQWLPSTPSVLLAACGSTDVTVDAAAARPPRVASVHLLDARTGRAERALALSQLAAEAGALGAAACSAAGSTLAVGLGAEVALLDLRRAGGGGGAASAAAAPAALLERYTDSHSEDVTGLQWHPALPAALLSGGEDGLVCAFDTAVAGEMDAIKSVLSVGSAVRHVGVFGAHGAHAHVATADGGFSLWNLGSAERLCDFPGLRAQAAGGGVAGWDFLVSARWDAAGGDALRLLAGGVGGELHLARVGRGEAALEGSLLGGHAACVRGAAWVEGGGGGGGARLFTGGEDGRLCAWGEGATEGGGEAGGGGAKAAKGKGASYLPGGGGGSGGGAPFKKGV
jgi:hypothetical protein